MNKTTLYRYFDSEGQLLYVGITGNIKGRQSQHAKKAEWFSQIANATYEHYDFRNDAFRAEAIAIRTEKPIHNIAMNNTQAEQSPYLDDFRLKLHLMQMFQDKDIDGKQFKPDAAHLEYSRELKSWGSNISDQLIVKNLHQLCLDNFAGRRALPCLSECRDCKDIHSTRWFEECFHKHLAFENEIFYEKIERLKK